jgi:hypothetical protein
MRSCSKLSIFVFFFTLLFFTSIEMAFAGCDMNKCRSIPLPERCEQVACNECPGCDSIWDPPKPPGFFGKVSAPQGVSQYGDFQTGMIKFANNLLKLIITGAAIFAFINIIIAGYNFLGAGGDSKKIESAWSKIWQSFLGLLIVAGSFVLAAIFGYLIFGDPGAILSPQIYGPPSN